MSQRVATKTHLVTDPTMRNMEAYRFDVPESWVSASAVKWVFGQETDPANDWTYPVNNWAHAEDPTTGDAIERFPQANFYYIPGMDLAPLGNMLSGVASWLTGHKPDAKLVVQPPLRMFGATSLAPMPAADALINMLVVRHRGSLPGYRVIRTFVPPELAGVAKTLPPNVSCEPIGVRIEYQIGDKVFEEDICAVRTLGQATSYGPMGAIVQTNWNLYEPYGLRAEKGTLDAKRALFQQILDSTKINPAWIAARDQICVQLGQQFQMYLQQGYDQIYAAGMVSRQISANNDFMLAGMEQQRMANNASFEAARVAANQPVGQSPADNFDDAIRGVTTYNDPYWGTSQHDGNYDYVWTDGSGGYRYSNEAGFDPNVGGTQNWQLMQRR